MFVQEINDAVINIPRALLCAVEDSTITRAATGVFVHTIPVARAHQCLQDYTIKKIPTVAAQQLFELALDLEDAHLPDLQLYQKITSLRDVSLQQLLYQAVIHALQRPAEEALKENPRLLLQLRTAKNLPLLHGPDFLENPDPISALTQEVAHAVLHPDPPPLLTNRQTAESTIYDMLARKFMKSLICPDQDFHNPSLYLAHSSQKIAYELLTKACLNLKILVANIENESVRYGLVA